MDDLLEPFAAAETPRPDWVVGTEAEKFGVFIEDLSPLAYAGTDARPGVRELLRIISDEDGWEAKREFEGGAIVGLYRNGASITLEPGGQLELSGAPFRSLWDTRREFESHLVELRAISSRFGIDWLAMGFHPTARPGQLPWVPKLRYEVMREYLPTRGGRGTDMMRRTATVQANLDYASASDAFRKLRAGLKLQPVVSVMFANSPFMEGRPSGALTERGRVWLDMDPDRSGLVDWAWTGPAEYERYVEWALDVPMFLFVRGATVHRNTGQTFRELMRGGFAGQQATYGDWKAHLNTLFPEVRVKNTLEFRTADSVPLHLVTALPALYKGLLYDSKSFDALTELLDPLSLPAVSTARRLAPVQGYRTELEGRPIGDWADGVLDLARAGLERLSGDGPSEGVLLDPLIELVSARQTLAEQCLAACPPDGPRTLEDLRPGVA